MVEGEFEEGIEGEFEEGIDDCEWCGECGVLRKVEGVCRRCEAKGGERGVRGSRYYDEVGVEGERSVGMEKYDPLRETIRQERSSPYALTRVSDPAADVRAATTSTTSAAGTSTKTCSTATKASTAAKDLPVTDATSVTSTKPNQQEPARSRRGKQTAHEKGKAASSSMSNRAHSQPSNNKVTIKEVPEEIPSRRHASSVERQESRVHPQQQAKQSEQKRETQSQLQPKREKQSQQHDKREKREKREKHEEQSRQHEKQDQQKCARGQDDEVPQTKMSKQPKAHNESKVHDKPAPAATPSGAASSTTLHPRDTDHTKAEEHGNRPHHRSVPSTASTIKPSRHQSTQPEPKPTSSQQKPQEEQPQQPCSPEKEWQKRQTFSEEQEQVEEWYQRWQRE